MNNSDESAVIVIGGGMAGLAATQKLIKRKNAILIEKESITGGRTTINKYHGAVLDASAQFLFGNYSTINQILFENKLENHRREISKETFAFYKEDKIYKLNIKDLIKYTSSMNKLDIFKLFHRLVQNKHVLKFTNITTTEELDTAYFSDWFKEKYNEELFEYIAQPITATFSLTEPEKISAAFGLALISGALQQKVFGYRGGIGEIANILKKNIEKSRRGKIITNCEVKKIVIDDFQVIGIETDKKYIKTDKIIAAVPAPDLIKLIEKKYIKNLPLEEIKYSQAIHCWALLNSEKIKKIALIMPRLEWPDHLAILETGIKSEVHLPQNKSMIEFFIFEKHAKKLMNKSDEEIKKKMVEDLGIIFKTNNDCIEWIKVKKIKNAIPIHSKNYNKIAKKIDDFCDIKGLRIAGDFHAMPCTETAAWSGERAANRILSEM